MEHPIQAAKSLTRHLLSRGAARIPLDWVRPLAGVSLLVPYYHMVSDNSLPHVSHLYRFRTIKEFTSDLEFLLRRFKPVTLRDIVDALDGTRPLCHSCFHLTFDDGFREMYEIVAPILQRTGVPGTFFLNTAFLDGGGLAHSNALSVMVDRIQSRHLRLGAASLRRMESLLPAATSDRMTLQARLLSIRYGQTAVVRSIAEILDVDLNGYVREQRPYLSSNQVSALLDSGFSVGAHSHDHPVYADLPLREQLEQTRKSMRLLDTRFGVSPRAFAFPHTDSGVQEAFFTEVFSEPLLDVSFGTAGLVSHFHPRNIERVGMEKTSAPAAQILARQYARATYLRLRPRAGEPIVTQV
jgi:peptidoglycan/xylan/chitin deacetylase (PgdA/CDA1 family)